MPDAAVDEHGAKRAATHLSQMGKRSRDVRDASYKIRTIFRKAEEARFASSGRGTWRALKTATRERKARAGLDPRTLRASNALYRSLTAPRARDQVDERRPDSLRFGTSVPYAGFHDAGRGVPKRQLIDLSPSERDDVERALEEYITRGDTGARW